MGIFHPVSRKILTLNKTIAPLARYKKEFICYEKKSRKLGTSFSENFFIRRSLRRNHLTTIAYFLWPCAISYFRSTDAFGGFFSLGYLRIDFGLFSFKPHWFLSGANFCMGSYFRSPRHFTRWFLKLFFSKDSFSLPSNSLCFYACSFKWSCYWNYAYLFANGHPKFFYLDLYGMFCGRRRISDMFMLGSSSLPYLRKNALK